MITTPDACTQRQAHPRESKLSWLAPMVLLLFPLAFLLTLGIPGVLVLIFFLGIRGAGWFLLGFVEEALLLMLVAALAALLGYAARRLLRLRFAWLAASQLLKYLGGLVIVLVLVDHLDITFGWHLAFFATPGAPFTYALLVFYALSGLTGFVGGYAVQQDVITES